jgi:hypothetical protein
MINGNNMWRQVFERLLDIKYTLFKEALFFLKFFK